MKLKFIRIREACSTPYGQLRGPLEAEHYDMLLLSGLAMVELDCQRWKDMSNYMGPVYVPVDSLGCLIPEKPLRKT